MKKQSKPNRSNPETKSKGSISFDYFMSVAAAHPDLTMGQVYTKILAKQSSTAPQTNRIER